jgi:parvulin-like peptidyl-prolyl isomerase
MEQKLDFSLPKDKEKKGASQAPVIVLLIAAVILSGTSLYLNVNGRRAEQAAGTHLSPQQMNDLVSKLSSRGLYDRAAIAMKEYVGHTNLGVADSAKAFFQIGDLLASAGKYDEAVEYYYRSEMFGKVADEQQMNAKLKDCFEKMGKFSALDREIASRTSIGGEAKADSPVVAEIGTEKLTAQKLDEMIEQQIDDQMARYAAFLKPEQMNERKKEMVRQYTEPETRQKFLEAWLGQEVLYRQAMEKGLADKPQVKRTVETMAKSIVAEQAMNEEVAGKVSITETDAKTWYEAHKSEYVEPAKAQISHILVDDESKAKEVLEKAKGGDFAALAKEYSKDNETKDKGGKVDAETTKGEYVAGVGNSKELNEKIFAMKEPALVSDAVKTEKGWEVVKVDNLTPERQKSFDDVRDTIYQQLRGEKTRDVQQAYVKQLMDKFNVVVHTSAFGQGKAAGAVTPEKSK